jgi:hypothetical protein
MHDRDRDPGDHPLDRIPSQDDITGNDRVRDADLNDIQNEGFAWREIPEYPALRPPFPWPDPGTKPKPEDGKL